MPEGLVFPQEAIEGEKKEADKKTSENNNGQAESFEMPRISEDPPSPAETNPAEDKAEVQIPIATEKPAEGAAPAEEAVAEAPTNSADTVPETIVPKSETQELTTEQIKELTDYSWQVTRELHQREDKRLRERYGTGFTGKARHWLNTTGIGRGVKIGGKIVIGTAAVIGAGMLSGGIGLLAAPAVYSLGIKEGVDGGIEAVQYLAQGRGRRLKLESMKQDFFQAGEETFKKLSQKLASGEINTETYQQAVNEVTKQLAEAEQEVIQAENDNISWERKQKIIRSIASTAAALGAGILHGAVLGRQDFDQDGVSHVVKWSVKGFDYIKDVGSKLGQAAGLGKVGPLLAPHYQAAAPAVAKMAVGLGAGAFALFAKTALELRSAFKKKQISSEDPKFLQVLDQNTPEGAEQAAENPPEQPAQEGQAPAGEAAGKSTTPEQPATESEKPFGEKQAEKEKSIEELQKRLDTIDNLLRGLDEEYAQIDAKELKTLADNERLAAIAEEYAALSDEKRSILEQLKGLDSKNTQEYANKRDELDQKLRALQEEWNDLDKLSYKTEAAIARQREIEQEYSALEQEKKNLRNADAKEEAPEEKPFVPIGEGPGEAIPEPPEAEEFKMPRDGQAENTEAADEGEGQEQETEAPVSTFQRGEKVTVRRTDGRIENDWQFMTSYNNINGIPMAVVSKQDGPNKILSKDIPISELANLNTTQ